MLKTYLTVLTILLSIHFLPAQEVIKITDANKIMPIGKQTWLYEDKTHKLSIETIIGNGLDGKFVPSKQDVPNYAMTHSTVWCKFKLENHTKEDVFLEIGNAVLDHIELYEVFDDGTFKARKAGILQPFSKRELQTNLFLFMLSTANQHKTQTFYLKLKNNFPLLLPLKVAALKPIFERNHPLDVFEGMYLGIVIIMALYNLFIYFSVRDKVYLWYVGYVVFSGILVSNVRGYAFEFMWADWYFVNNYASNFGNLVIICSTFFTINFLNTKKYVPKWEKVLYVFLFFSGVSIVLNLMGMKLESEMVGQATAVFMFLSLIITGILVYRAGFKTAQYYILAWTFFLFGAIILIADLNGAFESNFFTNHAMQFGSALEILLLSFALGDKINTYRKEKENAQQESLDMLKENERLILNQNRVLEEKVAERTEQLEATNEELQQTNEELNATLDLVDQERKKSDKLLLNILPNAIAVELKNHGFATPRSYEKVTILFTDFKGFTQIASTMKPEQILDNLNYCFTAFDKIIRKHGLEKIKTIGDAYMCAGGLPIPDDDNPTRVVSAALEIVVFIQNWKAKKIRQGKDSWDIRVGIHTGSVVAGVVGDYKFAYDIWGDAVNIASRMESSGELSKINISGTTYELIKEHFNCTYRGEIEAKNKGKIDMYFVENAIENTQI